ncbi:Focadhesin [Pseudolycoriella hygida]|uniref:Focadhesin n=1 Tax=Pseudolycoriella hygida TaxID=35572 RepID=A0A9Q0N047_9DIPT|nr:Focadhesin [Pseudolycoriella hygida]
MDELKHLTNKNNIQQITVGLQKLLKVIRSERAQGRKENQIKEIDYLRELCSSEYTNLSLLAYQAFVRLVQDGTIEAANCLLMFVAMLPSTKYNQYTALTEGVVDILLLDLKKRSVLEPTKPYICPYGLKAPQHPIIVLMQKSECNLSDLTNKINGICNHHDKEIRQHSIEFLRPVFLYTLCNLVIVPDSMTIWTCLLSQMKKSESAKELVFEILSYRKTDSSTATLKTSLLLSDAVAASGNVQNAIQLSLYLTTVLNDLSSHGCDPRPGFRIVRQVISEVKQLDRLTSDLFIILLNQSLHDVSPVYIPDVVRLLKLIIITKGGSNRVTRAMVLDGLIIWIANFSLVPADGLHGIKELIDFIINFDKQNSPPKLSECDDSCDVKFYHPSLSMAVQISRLSQRIDKGLEDGDRTSFNDFLDSIEEPSQTRFCHQIHLLLRGIFLSNKLPPQESIRVFKVLLKIVKENQDVAAELLLPVLFKLSKEKEPIVQLELLRGITQFAIIKENIPTILNTLNSMTSGALRPLSLDLYLRPTQHRTDLVVHLSNILNQSSGVEGETSTTIAIEAINFLCMSHTVNVASTWKALSHEFGKEKRVRPILALCKFFGQVPLLRSATLEYEELYNESISKLWDYVVNGEHTEIISGALMAMKNFDYCGFTLAQIPEIFRQNLVIPSAYIKTADGKANPVDVLDFVPGQCWTQLIEKVNPSARHSASDLVSHYIHNEIDSYRSGVYHLPEGKPEPNSLRQLHNRSPLRYVVEYLVMEAKRPIKGSWDVILNCLRCLSKRFPKPIPPLDMYFLVHFMNDDIELKRHCIQILTNQVVQSGTAKNLLENFAIKFNAEELTGFEEIHTLFEVLVDLLNGISTEISENLMRNLFDFCFRQSKFDSTVFDLLMQSIKPMFTQTCRNEDAMQMVAGLIESYFDLIEPEIKSFQKFMEVCETIPSPRLDAITSPSTWSSSKEFRKATIVRCHLAGNSCRLDNPLFWLNAIVDNISKFETEQTFVLERIACLLHRYGNDKNVSSWTMEIQSRVQAALSDKSQQNSEFLMDLFMMCIIVASGCSMLCGNVSVIASCRQSRLDGFPAALNILTERAFWRDCSVRIFEFLLHVYTHSKLPSCFIESAKSALICSKNDFYFTQRNNWIKYIGLRK